MSNVVLRCQQLWSIRTERAPVGAKNFTTLTSRSLINPHDHDHDHDNHQLQRWSSSTLLIIMISCGNDHHQPWSWHDHDNHDQLRQQLKQIPRTSSLPKHLGGRAGRSSCHDLIVGMLAAQRPIFLSYCHIVVKITTSIEKQPSPIGPPPLCPAPFFRTASYNFSNKISLSAKKHVIEFFLSTSFF